MASGPGFVSTTQPLQIFGGGKFNLYFLPQRGILPPAEYTAAAGGKEDVPVGVDWARVDDWPIRRLSKTAAVVSVVECVSHSVVLKATTTVRRQGRFNPSSSQRKWTSQFLSSSWREYWQTWEKGLWEKKKKRNIATLMLLIAHLGHVYTGLPRYSLWVFTLAIFVVDKL